MGISDLDPDAHGRRPWNAGSTLAERTEIGPSGSSSQRGATHH